MSLGKFEKAVQKLEEGDAWHEDDEVVDIEVAATLDKVIPVRLTSRDWEQLRREARTVGVGPTTLARMWLLESLQRRGRGRGVK